MAWRMRAQSRCSAPHHQWPRWIDLVGGHHRQVGGDRPASLTHAEALTWVSVSDPTPTVRASIRDDSAARGHTPPAPKPVSESCYSALRIAAAKPTSALPTSIIAASSLSQGAGRGTAGTATVAVTVELVISASLDPIVGVAAISPRIPKVKNRLRIKSSLVPRLSMEPRVPSTLDKLQSVCHGRPLSNFGQNTASERSGSIQVSMLAERYPYVPKRESQ